MRKMKAADILLDYTLHPRNNVDAHNVRSICDALEAGETMPPVIIERKSKRVVDGIHRVLAFLRRDPESVIDVIEKDYKNDGEMFLDAIKYNATHGARLDPCDRVHCVHTAERLHVPLDKVAGALHTSPEKLGDLRTYRTAIGSGGLHIPLKRTFQHMAGKRLNKAQVKVNERSSGMNQSFYANQLIDLIESELLDKQDEKLYERLRHLHGLLESLLVEESLSLAGRIIGIGDYRPEKGGG